MDLFSMPTISIIIPCFNYGKFISKTLDCLLEQTFTDWECIIVDDGSTDNSSAVIKSYGENDHRFRYLYQTNKGLSSARNSGILESKGIYIQLLDADDLIEICKLEVHNKFLNDNPEVDIVYSSVRYFRTDFPQERLYSMNRINKYWMPNVSGSGKEVINHLIENNIFASNCPLIRKSVFSKAGYFNESYKFLEDWEFWLRCALNNLNFQYVDFPKSLALVRVHSTSMSKSIWSMRYVEYEMKLNLKKQVHDKEIEETIDAQLIKLKKILISIALYDLFLGKGSSFKDKIKIVTEESSFMGAVYHIFKNKYFPVIDLGKILFYGKQLIKSSK
ncbi:glycosyltransferase [Adhaeribacter swui]|uniref:Glycosyltransferase n=1 Tax=Adhaeribacter swui TaxID=2086471 RepID=A0A7G7GCV5_9BACT|nr:glycosyltransferase [Adhaeribacter swui]QNF34989.1 glycosyltransferase [Adhaeribacter swui]